MFRNIPEGYAGYFDFEAVDAPGLSHGRRSGSEAGATKKEIVAVRERVFANSLPQQQPHFFALLDFR